MKTWDTVAVVGVGLLGGSIGLALRQQKLAQNVIGIGRRPTSLRAAKKIGAVTRTTTDLETGVCKADLVIICTPVDLVVEHARNAALYGPAGVLVTDVGSTKEAIVVALDYALEHNNPRHASFVGSHPMAGGEKHGPRHARADLLEGRTVVVTPSAQTPTAAVREIERLWKSLGAKVQRLSPKIHDQAVASISHLPHLVAAALAGATRADALALAANGWLDTTRIAAGDPELWTQILAQNRLNVLESLDGLERGLADFRKALVYNDFAQLAKLLQAGKAMRERGIEK